ncbi:Spermatogenesis-associated protein 24 [Geodia barretti]|nr:Spermatogenesis-associated protein 24 [Geodia barretti]
MSSAVDSNIAALQQCGDILRIQEEACNILKNKLQATREHAVPHEDFQSLEQELECEKADHQQTRRELEGERERARLAESELAILRRQLSREKTTFENA